ncbi:Uncharacterised protein [Chlamydia trachomatis]|nr:Uncharacterised protein [Chlamydia trachomatis]
MNVLEAGARFVCSGKRGLACVQNSLVDTCLDLGELSVDRQCAGDVGGVEGIDLNASVNQNQIALVHRTIVVDPVQGVRVIARCCDRVVAKTVALFASNRTESALDDALTTVVTDGAGESLQNIGEALIGDIDRALKFSDFERILA